MEHILIFIPVLLDQRVVNFLLLLEFLIVNARAIGAVAFDILCISHCGWGCDKSAIDTTHQRVSAQTVRAMDQVVALAGLQQTSNVCALYEVNPEPAH